VRALEDDAVLVVGQVRVRLERVLGRAFHETPEELHELILALVVTGEGALARDVYDRVVGVGGHEAFLVSARLRLVGVAQHLLVRMQSRTLLPRAKDGSPKRDPPCAIPTLERPRPPSSSVTSIGAKSAPVVSTPRSSSAASASVTMSFVNASADGGAVITVAPSRFGVLCAISAARSQAAWSMKPTPLVAGQISLLISFICHSWWLLPSLEPLATTMSRQASTLSRQ
jgi:hypothetical protein